MKIIQLEVENILGVPNGLYKLSPSVTLVTGGPASGKSSFLRAIVAAKESVGATLVPPDPKAVLRRGAVGGQLSARWSFSESEQRAAKLPEAFAETAWTLANGKGHLNADAAVQFQFARYSNDADVPKIEFVPCPRVLSRGLGTLLGPPISDGTEALRRPSEAPDKYAGIFSVLSEVAMDAAAGITRNLDERGVLLRAGLKDALDPYKGNVAKMCPHLRLVAVEPRSGLRPLLWFQVRKGERVELLDLSQSEVQGVLLACLFVMIGLHGSLVLIDTPELSIHPKDQARFFKALCDLGSNNQVVAATSSPEILELAAPDQILNLSLAVRTEQ